MTHYIAWPEETTGSTAVRTVPVSVLMAQTTPSHRTSPYASPIPRPLRLSPERSQPAALSDGLREIAALQRLQDGWDGDDALAITPQAVMGAQRLLEEIISARPMLARSLRPILITAVPDGGVQLEWGSAERLIEIEVAGDGTIGFLFADRSAGKPEFLEETSLSTATAAHLVTQLTLAAYSA